MTKKKVILVFGSPKKYELGVDMLLSLGIAFNALRKKYVVISQSTFAKNDCIDLYSGCDAIFSSTI